MAKSQLDNLYEIRLTIQQHMALVIVKYGFNNFLNKTQREINRDLEHYTERVREEYNKHYQ